MNRHHLPTFRTGDLVLFEIEVLDVAKGQSRRFDPQGGVVISVWASNPTVPTLADEVPMTRVRRGIYQYELQTEQSLEPGMFMAQMVAIHGNLAQSSQLYAPFRLVL